MKRRLGLAVLVVLCLLSLRPANARQWTDSSGNHKIEAELVKVDGEVVHLKKSDGAIVKVPLNKLCLGDRRFIQEQLAVNAASPKADSEVGPGTSQPASDRSAPARAANDPTIAKLKELVGEFLMGSPDSDTGNR